MKVQIQIYVHDQDERQAILDAYENRLAHWLEQDNYAKGDPPERPIFPTKFCTGKIDVSDLLSYYVITPSELIRIETKSNYYTVKYDSEVLDILDNLIPDSYAVSN